MGQVYREEYDENGNAIDPAFYVQNQSAYAGGFNGSLDRDNFGAADLATAELVDDNATVGCANALRSASSTGALTIDADSTSWQDLLTLTWTSTEDAHYDVHAGGTWQWVNGAASITSDASTARADTQDVRVIVDGSQVCIAGPFEDEMQYESTGLIGSIVLPAGAHTARMQASLVRRIYDLDKTVEDIATGDVSWTDRSLYLLERRR